MAKQWTLIVVTVFCISLSPSREETRNDEVLLLYVYGQQTTLDDPSQAAQPEISQIRWVSLNTAHQEIVANVPDLAAYMISPDNTHIAFEEATGQIHILDLLDHSIITLELHDPKYEFLWDEHYLRSGSLLWSPDGTRLAFTGSTMSSEPSNRPEANVYIYDIETGELENPTKSIPIRAVLPASWSPDSRWLMIYGAWSEKTNAQGYVMPVFGSAAISLDDDRFLELAPGYETCRLQWSPDMQWVASNLGCSAPIGASSGLTLIPFDPEPLEGGYEGFERLDQVISPIVLDWQTSRSWFYYYGSPLWIDDEILVTYRRIGPMTMGLLSEAKATELSSEGLVSFNVQTQSEVLFTGDEFRDTVHKLENWFVTADESGHIGRTAYNPLIDQYLHIPPVVRTCPIQYAMQIDAAGSFVAVLDACYPPDEMAPYAVRIYETEEYKEIVTLEIPDGVYIQPIGFIETP